MSSKNISATGKVRPCKVKQKLSEGLLYQVHQNKSQRISLVHYRDMNDWCTSEVF